MTVVRADAAESATTLVREGIAGVIGAAIALACLLPPLLHLVTGPLGPLIGGFVVAHRIKPSPRGRIVIASTLGITLAGIVGAAAAAVVAFSAPNELPDWLPSSGSFGLILAGVWLHATALGALGATLGARGAAEP